MCIRVRQDAKITTLETAIKQLREEVATSENIRQALVDDNTRALNAAAATKASLEAELNKLRYPAGRVCFKKRTVHLVLVVMRVQAEG